MRHLGTSRRLTCRVRRSRDLVFVFNFFFCRREWLWPPHGVSALRLLEPRHESAPQLAIGARSAAARNLLRETSRLSRARTLPSPESPRVPRIESKTCAGPLQQSHPSRWWSRSTRSMAPQPKSPTRCSQMLSSAWWSSWILAHSVASSACCSSRTTSLMASQHEVMSRSFQTKSIAGQLCLA